MGDDASGKRDADQVRERLSRNSGCEPNREVGPCLMMNEDRMNVDSLGIGL